MNLSVSLDSGDEFNPPVIEESSDMAQSSQKSMDQAVPPRKLPFSMDPRDEDPRFQQLCLQAARSFHQMRAVEFDEEYTILHDKDIEISVVELKLPLGRKFGTVHPSLRPSLTLDFSHRFLYVTFTLQ